ncbi:MAG: Maf family protein [Rhodothermales bacterium]
MNLLPPFVLASGSPRRRRLLEGLGLAFEVVVSDVEETVDPALSPEAMVQHLAQKKAAAVAASHPEALTLGADTIVVLEGDVLGKPAHEAEARAMLRGLSGATHEVYTGIALLHPRSNRCQTSYEATRVTFGALTDQEIDAYVASGSPMDKAGGYGIQDDHGALFVARIDGDYYNVVGLPLHRLYRLLRDEFTDLVTV